MMAKPFLSIDDWIRLPVNRGAGRHGTWRRSPFRHDCLDEWPIHEGTQNLIRELGGIGLTALLVLP